MVFLEFFRYQLFQFFNISALAIEETKNNSKKIILNIQSYSLYTILLILELTILFKLFISLTFLASSTLIF